MKNSEFRDAYLDQVEALRDGESKRLWHCKPEGTKGNDAFVVTRDKDTFKYYCFHCEEKGIYRARTNVRGDFRPSAPRTYTKVLDTIKLPSDCDPVFKNWPSKFKVWLLQYEITLEEIKKYGICYSSYFDRLVFPIHGNTGILTGWTGRSLDQVPKYLLRRTKDYYMWSNTRSPSTDTVVIVEDIVSGIKCGRFQDSISLCGTSLQDRCLKYIINNYKKTNIILDNDNYMVIKKQYKLNNRLLLYIDSNIIKLSKDPKEYSNTELEKILLPTRTE